MRKGHWTPTRSRERCFSFLAKASQVCWWLGLREPAQAQDEPRGGSGAAGGAGKGTRESLAPDGRPACGILSVSHQRL